MMEDRARELLAAEIEDDLPNEAAELRAGRGPKLIIIIRALRAIAAARAQEREECAKVADLVSENLCDCDYRLRNKEAVDAAEAIAAAIRNREKGDG